MPEATSPSQMKSADYGEPYWEHGVGSNYVRYGDDPGWPTTVAVLTRWLPPGGKLFEVACAKGWFVLHARRLGFEASGLDISQWAVSQAHPEVAPWLTLGNAAVWPILPRRWYDAVVSWEFLEHVPFGELAAVLQNMERAVEPGGLLVHRIGIEMADGEDHGHQQDVTHQQEMPREWWHGLLSARGWQHRPEVEASFDLAFTGRDWAGRFFAYRWPG
jgi:cyclopropane fatty-acyl-phospholipid synthase-like methyltransferase